MQRCRIGVHHFFDFSEGLAAAALYHVGRQRPGTAGETDQRHFAVEVFANGAHRIHNIAKFLLGIGHRQFIDIGAAGNGMRETRAFAGFEVESQPHRVGDRQDIAEEDRRIKRIAAQRLQGDFTRQFGVFAQRHKITGYGARRFVLRQITPGLSHHPYRRDIDRLT